jgi:hypothetical protein
MLKVALVGIFVLILAAIPASYLALEKTCSLEQGRNDEYAERASNSSNSAAPNGQHPNPTATFNLRITGEGTVDGNYYAKNAEGEKEKWTHKFWCDAKIGEFALVVFTLFLVVFTGGLWWSTHRLWKAGEKQIAAAQASANAATLSAKAAIGIKLPIVRCDTPTIYGYQTAFADTGWGFRDFSEFDFLKITSLTFTNHGETPFYPYEYGLGWLITDQPAVERETVPPDPEYPDVYEISRERVISNTLTTERIITFCLQTDGELKTALNNATKNLRVLAYIKYRDFLGDEHEARFCWRWKHSSRDGSLREGLYEDHSRVPYSYTRKT